MAEYQEVVKQFNRMCESYGDTCEKCLLQNPRGILTCWRWCFEEPVKAEEIVMNWAKEHPPITNNDKIKEIFGLDFKSTFRASPWTLEWLDEEYKEPKDDLSV